MPCYEQIEIDGIVVMSGGVREAADVTRRDRLPHPFDEHAAIVGRANVPQAAQAGARQPTKLWIAHTEESRPRVCFVFQQSLPDLCE